MNRIFGSKKDKNPPAPVKQEEPEEKAPAPDLVEQSKKVGTQINFSLQYYFRLDGG